MSWVRYPLGSHLPSPWRKHASSGDCKVTPWLALSPQHLPCAVGEAAVTDEFTDESAEYADTKDTIVNAVGASHDIHLLKIDNREDELVTRINSWCTRLVDKIHRDEIMRNRKRVKEINLYIDHMKSELDNLEYSDILD
ncbi:hypothetical protein P7K49_010423 [Saguinus oedipus]|uniref:Uncharacterized protein n=1 Tax=Saguinus oedipus TaxID=9490 RepID=A0ABQ9VR29_SAGOE|nr:hypothetical protein P7K49_010423 [Saguinus oedipus]